jgi:uncharacterized protein
MDPPVSEELAVVRRIAAGRSALVALSGGVDSSVVAALAREALGAQAVAITLTGSAVARSEVEAARDVARAVGIEHHTLLADPIEREAYRRNPTDRCYHCRSVEAGVLREWGRSRGIAQYLDGVQTDDLLDDRPGLRAMEEAGFSHPLLWGGWDKPAVRAIARRRGLPNSDRPSNACLASRVAHGEPITVELLRRIEAGEEIVRALGFRRVRVRVRQGGARIEVDPDEVDRLLGTPTGSEVVRRVRALGFSPVEIDRCGYRGGRELEEIPVVR